MLTPNDLRNPKRKSGFDHVSDVMTPGARLPMFRATSGPKKVPGDSWYSPKRRTAEEAAQDYCDHENAKNPITIEDIRNPKRKSGFDYVSGIAAPNSTKANAVAAGGANKWRAEKRTGPGSFSQNSWRGPARFIPEEAAQDACDYINGQRGATPAPRTSRVVRVERAKLRFVKHPRKVRTRTGATKTSESKPRREKEGPGYVYLLGMLGSPVEAVKIGESKDEAQYRLAGLQTGNPFELYVIGQIKADKRLALEEELHLKFAKFHHQNPHFVGEWFAKDDSIVKHFTNPAAQSGGTTTKEVKSV